MIFFRYGTKFKALNKTIKLLTIQKTCKQSNISNTEPFASSGMNPIVMQRHVNQKLSGACSSSLLPPTSISFWLQPACSFCFFCELISCRPPPEILLSVISSYGRYHVTGALSVLGIGERSRGERDADELAGIFLPFDYFVSNIQTLLTHSFGFVSSAKLKKKSLLLSLIHGLVHTGRAQPQAQKIR